MHSEQTWQRRRLLREARGLCSDGRYVDFGVRLFTVAQAPDGAEVLPGRPLVARVREPEDFGGVWDTRLQQWHDESACPIVWYCSELQRPLILHGDELPDQIIVRGGEGAGKTRGIVAPWALMRAILDFAGQNVELGGTAPTLKRLETLRIALFEKAPPDWYSWRQRDQLMRLRCGVDLRLLSTHRASEAEGSPIQGYDWAGHFGDEGQDQLHAMDDIATRGRRAPGGRYRRMMSCSVKDSPAYRSFEDKWSANPRRAVVSMPGQSNPFVAPEHWQNLFAELDDRAYRRRVLAEAVGPENAVYYNWDRKENLRRVPDIGAEDVTAEVLRPWGPNFGVLVGHDPGKLFDVSVLLKAYRLPGQRRYAWWVVGELTTEGTTEDHVIELVRVLQEDPFRCNQRDWQGRPAAGGRLALVRADPYSDSGNDDNRPDRSVYTTFRRYGLTILPGATKPAVDKVTVARVPKDAGIQVVVGLICAADKTTRRLFVDCDANRQPAAPRLVEALEMSERAADGKAEQQKKDRKDLSHWPAALRYALWAIEKPKLAEAA